MKLRKKILVVAIAGILSSPTAFADGVWNDVNAKNVAISGARSISPQRYRLLALNRAALKSTLDLAPLEDTESPGVVLTLPLPNGEFAEFSVVEAPIMDPRLAAKFPELKTYLGTGLDDPTATLRVSITPQGFYAQILSATGAWYIDPYQKSDTTHHISYERADYTRPANAKPFECHVDDIPQPSTSARQSLVSTPISHGTQRRTYRIAIAATGEFTAFHGGTVDAAMEAIIVGLTRVNGIYEKEVAVRMILVDNNNEIVYTDAASDPYSNVAQDVNWGDENQANIDNVIGNANYDIGHLFNTYGGGGVSIGVCNNESKASGYTGIGGMEKPLGDPFFVDYVAHEIGHQFHANHTFNGTAGACNTGVANTAYEPGSGSTILSYAGICHPDDLQAHSDPYFHAISLQEIVKFITTDGDICGVKEDINNSPPTVDAGPNGTPAFTIPKNTPFQLTGTASDVDDDDVVTYAWEEFDLGPAGAPDSPSGNAPIFRSFLPSTNPTRTFPKLADLLNNTHTIGELLPTYARDLKFILTARDNYEGGGGINQDLIVLKVSGSAGPFVVTAPNTPVVWTVGKNYTVTWNAAGTTAAPISCANVKLLLSTDGGNSFPTTLLAVTPNDGNQAIVVPNKLTTKARLKVACANNVFFDISNANFTIAAKTLQINDISKAEGNAGVSAYTFTVTLSSASTSPITVKYATANGTALAPSDYTAASGTLTFAAGQTSKTVTINVVGNTAVEQNETFVVNLNTAVGATIADGQGVATIINDDGPLLRINDVIKAESNSGVTPFAFTATLLPASASTVTVKYATANGTALAPSDYATATGTLTFSPGQTSKIVTVNAVGNMVVEPNEYFFVNLHTVTGPATLFDEQGMGTITNDD